VRDAFLFFGVWVDWWEYDGRRALRWRRWVGEQLE